MATYITVLEGPLAGQQFEIKGGERFGREKGDIILSDPKASNNHAVVKKSLLGQLTLIDQKSKNGIILDGQKVEKVKLIEGIEFRIGANVFRVELQDGATQTKSKNLKTNHQIDHLERSGSDNLESVENSPEESVSISGKLLESLEKDEVLENHDDFGDSSISVKSSLLEDSFLEHSATEVSVQPSEYEVENPISNEIDEIDEIAVKNSSLSLQNLDPDPQEIADSISNEPELKVWNFVLESFSRNHIRFAKDEPQKLAPFHPKLKLTFVRGTQAETEWEIGYGPRSAGRFSLDLQIWEPSVPDQNCFVLAPTEEGPRLTTDFPSIVKVNGKSLKEVTLKSGDVISIYETAIEVEFF